MAFRDTVQFPQKLFIAISGVLILGIGCAVLVFGINARSSDGFGQLQALMEEESNNAFDSGSAIYFIIILSVVIIIMGLSACWGALRESHCFLCLYTCFALVSAMLLIGMCASLHVFMDSQWAAVVKSTNRMCGPGAADMFQKNLNCTSLPVPTAAPNNGAIKRRLTQAVGGALVSLLPRDTAVVYTLATQAGFSYMDKGEAGRRLYPGTTEESLVIRTCAKLGAELCPSPCSFVDLLCEEPEGFDQLRSCVCDRSGPRAQSAEGIVPIVSCPSSFSEPEMCNTDEMGRTMGVFCVKQTSSPDEACFVLPTADCEGRGWSKPGFGETDPSISAGPCLDPDPRSRLLVEGEKMIKHLIAASFLLGVIVLLSACCSFCLFVELYTGKGVGDHGRMVMQDDTLEGRYEDEDDDDFAYPE